MQNTIVFTVPHATSIQGIQQCNEHIYCDSYALYAARLLQSRLGGALLVGDINRSQLDLNRLESRHTSRFRSQLRASLSHDVTTLILDIHSYPPSETWGLSFSPSCVFLIDSPTNVDVGDLRRNFPNVPILPGQSNDIMDEMTELGYKSILIEFREGSSDQVVLDIAAGFKKFL